MIGCLVVCTSRSIRRFGLPISVYEEGPAVGAFMALRSHAGTIALAAVAVVGALAYANAATTKKPESSARYWVQSGAFKSGVNAKARCDLLNKQGFRFGVQSGLDSHGENLFFCRSSQALMYEKAASLAQQLRLKDPHDAVLVLRRSNEVLSRGVDARKKASRDAALVVHRSNGLRPHGTDANKKGPGEGLESFSGRWCGDPAIYGTDPLQTWTVKKDGTVTLQIAARRTLDGKSEQFRVNIEQLPGNLIRLVGETEGSRSEAVYAIEASGLRGVSFHQEMEDSGTSMTTIPDSLHRCP